MKPLGCNPELLRSHKYDFLSAFTPLSGFLPYEDRCYSPYPISVSLLLFTELGDLANTLMRAVRTVAENYLIDSAMQSLMPLPVHLVEFLKMSHSNMYQAGTMRPDLLFGKYHEIKVCEINARFPLNGMLSSQWVSQASFAHEYSDSSCSQLPDNIGKIQDEILERFDVTKPLGWVSHSESGTESRFFLQKFAELGGLFIELDPLELSLQDGRVQGQGVEIEQFILEIDREELCLFDPPVLNHIVQQCNYINDVRTLILVHDKRILSILGDRLIMQNYLQEEDLVRLARHIPETLDLGNQDNYKRVLTTPSEWVIKKISGGRGVGMLIGVQCDAVLWRETLENHSEEYMAQSYVPLDTFDVIRGDSIKPMHVVGSLPCFDGLSFGLGMYRASSRAGINLGDGSGDSIMLGSAVDDTKAGELLDGTNLEPASAYLRHAFPARLDNFLYKAKAMDVRNSEQKKIAL
jgi:hypothetical protein